MAHDNKLLGEFNLDGIPPAPRGMPQIEVTFDIDANGIAKVSAKDKASGKEQHIQIKSSGGLSDEEIKKMTKEAEENAAKDSEKVERAKAKNDLDNAIYATEKGLREYGDKVDGETKSKIESKLSEAKEILAKDDSTPDAMKTITNELQEVSMKLGEAMYKAQAEQQGSATSGDSSAGSQSTANPEDIKDAEFKEVKEDDK